ncbi:MAG: helix-turn-helix domain-containing protein [Clostridia bacterium]|nr:helix-turn-helix domain-containing protein [Clostridia bacterium]
MKAIKFTSNIKLLRNDFHLSQLQLAIETGLGKSAVSYWELGVEAPNAKAVIILSRYFQVTTDYLLKESDNSTPVYRADDFNVDMFLFNKRLKELRIEHNLSQDKLATEVKLSQSAINNWELGNRTPNANAVVTLARYFGVTTDYLLGEID